jgi:hypothetical protein
MLDWLMVGSVTNSNSSRVVMAGTPCLENHSVMLLQSYARAPTRRIPLKK